MTKTKTIPTPQEIDALAEEYISLASTADAHQFHADQKKKELADLIAKNGFTPARATKSLRLEGAKWKCTLSQSDSVEIDGTETERFFAALKFWNLAWMFRFFFRRRSVFVLVPKAQQCLENFCARSKHADKAEQMRAAFNRCLQVKSSAPGLKVEPIEKEKEARAS